MIVLSLLFIIIALILFTVFNRKKESLWLISLFSSFILVNLGLMLYYAKLGGLSSNEQILFFLVPNIKRSLQSLIITLDSIARILTIGQLSFVFFALMFSLNLTGFLHHRPWIIVCVAIFPITSILLSDPAFGIMHTQNSRYFITVFTGFCLRGYSLCAIFIMWYEYHRRRVFWMRRHFFFILVLAIDLITYFLIFGLVNPISICYPDYYGIFTNGFPLYKLQFSLSAWVITTIIFLLFIVLGFISLFWYTELTVSDKHDKIELERQITIANMGTKVFIHGMKNQLFAQQILLEQIQQQMASENISEQFRNYFQEVNHINQTMMERMDILHKSFHNNKLSMTPHLMSDIVKNAIEKSRQQLKNVSCDLWLEEDALVLVDMNYFCEAIYNLIINAKDAISASDQRDFGKITISLSSDHTWCAIKVQDNGIGIEKSKLKQIFEPFYTKKNTNYNWGVGLTSARQIVRSHFGHLFVESHPGIGSVFTVVLPRFYYKQ
ncbi:MAG: sensor histidine kinase [Lachnospiraceae bacterium]|jgi:signal transduction histidine kinase